MESIDEKKKKRFEFLRHLYNITVGNTGVVIDMYDVGGKMGLNGSATSSLVQYLIGEGLVRPDTSRALLGAKSSDIRITHEGVKVMENPERPTKDLPAGNIIQIGTNIGSPIQQGGSGNIQVTQYRREDLQALSGIIDSILKDLETLKLQPDDERQVRVDLQTAREQANSPKPKHDIIKICLKTAFDILKGVGTALAIKYADKLLPFLQSIDFSKP